MTQRSVLTGSIFEPSRYRITWLPLFQISPASYGHMFNNRC